MLYKFFERVWGGVTMELGIHIHTQIVVGPVNVASRNELALHVHVCISKEKDSLAFSLLK